MTHQELEILKTNSLSLGNARIIASQIESDYTAGGVFPKAGENNFTEINEKVFKAKWCFWWKFAKILLKIAKIFTKSKGDKVIDNLLKLGNKIC
jgi:hypothetical protein